jgi:hypothetical protein
MIYTNLIPLLSNTFNNIEQNAFLIWKFNNFKLIYQYRPCQLKDVTLLPMPPPLNLLNVIVFLVKLILQGRKNEIKRKLTNKKEDEIYESILGI